VMFLARPEARYAQACPMSSADWGRPSGMPRADRILVNAVCPGWTGTDMGQGGRPVTERAASVMWAVLLPDDGPNGGFYRDGQPLPW
jgi:NAD(P)-dependent dehydrogenase (short-subunit alcohol dehydrogenase family)